MASEVCRNRSAAISEGEDMRPKRILGLAIAASALATSAALAATTTNECLRGTITSASALSMTVDTGADKPVTVAPTGNPTYLKVEKSNLNKIGKGGFVGSATLDVGGIQVAQQVRAPNETPTRIDNVWGGFDHQPTESQVQSAELARGVALNALKQRREEQIVRQLNQELLKRVGRASPDAAPG
jgi:hypothetical protein